MYYRHFGLNGAPFQFSVTPAELFEGEEQRETIAALGWGLAHEPTGYTLLVGEPGTGKTTIVRSLIARHQNQIRAAYLNYPKAEPLELFRHALRQLGSPASQVSKFECVQAFRECLNELRSDQRLALVFDEAQALSPLLFEELRLLANCASTDERRLQVIFIGQPSILKRLEAPMLRQLNERIGTRVVLRSMSDEQARHYIEHRVSARNGSANKLFARRALDLIVEHSHGIPRRINVLCHNSMLSAYAAGAPKVRLDLVRTIINEFENVVQPASVDTTDTRAPVWRRLWKYSASAAVLSALSIGPFTGSAASRNLAQGTNLAVAKSGPKVAANSTTRNEAIPSSTPQEEH